MTDKNLSDKWNPRLIRGKMNLAAKGRLAGNKEPSQEISGSGPTNAHGLPKLPPGQHVTKSWPVLDLGEHPDISKQDWLLTVKGLVKTPLTLTWEDFMACPQVTDVSDFHCVTSWSLMDSEWKGVPLKYIMEKAGVLPEAVGILFTAYDDYTTNLRCDEIDEDVLLVHTWNGQPLPREHGGPVRVIVPRKYAWKGAKWVKAMEFLPENRPGFWEQRGYSNSAEPWYDDRYS